MRTKLFESKKLQTLHLPESVALPVTVKEVDIIVVGRSRLITTAGEAWDEWFDATGASDPIPQREQPQHQKREEL